MKWIFLLVLISSSLTSSIASTIKDIPWEDYSDPGRMSDSYNKSFKELPLWGQVLDTRKYWSSDYWPLFKGSINYRWNSKEPVGFGYKSPSRRKAARMTLDELKSLSPSEKYDLYLGKYSYPLKKAVKRRASPTRRVWEGICHGWAAAALNHIEPKPVVVKNPQGIMIPFGSSDLKALLSYYYANHYDPVSTHQMGRRCNGTEYCDQDLNAGAFHIVLANQVGIAQEGFINDIENGREVWNQVVYNYTSEITKYLRPTENSAPGTSRVIRMKTSVRVVMNIVQNSWEPANRTPMQTFKDNVYEYDLDLDRAGTIIGGEWRSVARPDFLWTVKPETKFRGSFLHLPKLLL